MIFRIAGIDAWIAVWFSTIQVNISRARKCMVQSEDSLSMGVPPAQDSLLNANRKNQNDIPIWKKIALTLEEASAYSGIGVNKLREITNEKNCRFVLFVGAKRLIKRKLFDQFIEESYSI